eukprot:TRINITY_DN23067_c0_g1_i1.p1 TRINITY_DN23067_c0_g1~~TRINITY_DN23067_c0_g1_i1.p1  ORF type:complete len:647 (+),score=124.28 TRINITY_DN23067_c0_g1_i1:195-1943(+)
MTVIVDFMGLNIQNPLMPFYIEAFEDAKDFGVGAATSMLVASYALSQFISTPLFGFGSDKFGRKRLLMLSMLGSCLGFLGQAFCKSLVSLCVMRFVTGLFGGSRPVALAYIGDTVPPEQQPKYITGITMGISLSLFLAPALGGSMGLIDLALPCYFQAGCAFVGLVLNYMYLKEPQRRPAPSTAAAGGKADGAQRPYKGWLVANAIVGSLIMFAITAWVTLLPLHATAKLGLDQNKIGLIFGVAGLATALAQFLAFMPLTKCVSVKVIGLIGLPMVALISLVPFGPNQVWFVLVLVFLHSFGVALCMPGVSMTVNFLAPASVRGGLVSLTIMSQASMRIVAPLVVGPLYDANTTYPFYIIVGAIAVALIFEGLLTTRVPMMKKLAVAAGKLQDAAQTAEPSVDEEREDILQNLHEVHDQLIVALDNWRATKAGLLEGKSREQLGLHPDDSVPAKPSTAQKKELGDWFTDMLIEHNYQRWPEHVDIVKCMCRNAFPKVRGSGFLNRYDDIEHILESHLMLEQQWEQFVLQKSLVEFGAAEFDWSSLQALASQSHANSVVSGDCTSSKPQEEKESVTDSFVMDV